MTNRQRISDMLEVIEDLKDRTEESRKFLSEDVELSDAKDLVSKVLGDENKIFLATHAAKKASDALRNASKKLSRASSILRRKLCCPGCGHSSGFAEDKCPLCGAQIPDCDLDISFY